MAEAVISRAFLRVAQHAVSLGRFLEFLLGVPIVGIPIGVVLQGKLAVRALQLLVVSVPVDTENFVVVSFCHGVQRRSGTLHRDLHHSRPQQPSSEIVSLPENFQNGLVLEQEKADLDLLKQKGMTIVPTQVYLKDGRAKLPGKIIINAEPPYEGHAGCNGPEVQRYSFWTSMLSGAGGFTYGAAGIFQANDRERPTGNRPDGGAFDADFWDDAMMFPGGAHEFPFATRWKSRAAASLQTRSVNTVNDLLRCHLEQGFAKSNISIVDQIIIQAFWIYYPDAFKHHALLDR